MPFFTVADLLLKRRKQIERNVRGLKIFRTGVRHVMHKRSKSRGPRSRTHFKTRNKCPAVHPRNQASSNGFDIPFHSANLSRKEYPRMLLHLQRLAKQGGCIDVGIPVNLPVPEKASMLEPRNQPQHARLLAEVQMILESDEVVRIRSQI